MSSEKFTRTPDQASKLLKAIKVVEANWNRNLTSQMVAAFDDSVEGRYRRHLRVRKDEVGFYVYVGRLEKQKIYLKDMFTARFVASDIVVFIERP